MSTTVLQTLRLAPVASTAAATPSFFQRLWTALEAHGQRRAATELRRVAERHMHGDPALARRLLEAADRV
jgi:hypothetical protein